MPSRRRTRAFEDIAARVKLHMDVTWLYVGLKVLKGWRWLSMSSRRCPTALLAGRRASHSRLSASKPDAESAPRLERGSAKCIYLKRGEAAMGSVLFGDVGGKVWRCSRPKMGLVACSLAPPTCARLHPQPPPATRCVNTRLSYGRRLPPTTVLPMHLSRGVPRSAVMAPSSSR
jgi:hypothetical protein